MRGIVIWANSLQSHEEVLEDLGDGLLRIKTPWDPDEPEDTDEPQPPDTTQ